MNYITSLPTHNADAALQFTPGTGVDKLTQDIGAMNYNSTIWTAGISWNTNSLTGSSLETFISNNRMNMYVVVVSTNSKLIGPSYFSEQQRKSTLNLKRRFGIQ